MANKQQREIYKENKENLSREQAAASFFKAQWEKMYYMVEAEKIFPEWAEIVIRKYPDQAKNLGLVESEVISPLSIVEGTEFPTTTLTVSDADIKE